MRDGRLTVASRALRSANGSLRSQLQGAGHSASILETHDLNEVADRLFPEGQGRTSDKRRSRILALIEDHNLAIEALSAPADEAGPEVHGRFHREASKLLRELFEIALHL